MSENLARPDRLQVMLDPQELAAIDDFRFGRRMPSRAAAVRELMRRGLAAEGFDLAPVGAPSQSFGVLGQAGPSPGNGTKAKSARGGWGPLRSPPPKG